MCLTAARQKAVCTTPSTPFPPAATPLSCTSSALRCSPARGPAGWGGRGWAARWSCRVDFRRLRGAFACSPGSEDLAKLASSICCSRPRSSCEVLSTSISTQHRVNSLTPSVAIDFIASARHVLENRRIPSHARHACVPFRNKLRMFFRARVLFKFKSKSLYFQCIQNRDI